MGKRISYYIRVLTNVPM